MINEILSQRKQLLTEEQKAFIRKFVVKRLIHNDYAIIEGARHFSNHGTDCWIMRYEPERNFYRCRAPYRLHPAIDDYLRASGFQTCRYINGGGVDFGLKVYITN